MAECVGTQCLAEVFEVLALGHCGGFADMSDLMQALRQAHAMLVEVKGPTDHPSDRQRWWMRFLSNTGIRCSRSKSPRTPAHARTMMPQPPPCPTPASDGWNQVCDVLFQSWGEALACQCKSSNDYAAGRVCC